MTKLRSIVTIFCVVIVVLYAGLNLYLLEGDVQTTSPTLEQVRQSQNEMYLNKNIVIEPLGFKFIGSGIDDSVWFKFRTETKIADIFNSEVVDLELLSKKYSMISSVEIEWWNIGDKALLGGQISLPNNKIMNVGIDDRGGGVSVVYIMWHGM